MARRGASPQDPHGERKYLPPSEREPAANSSPGPCGLHPATDKHFPKEEGGRCPTSATPTHGRRRKSSMSLLRSDLCANCLGQFNLQSQVPRLLPGTATGARRPRFRWHARRSTEHQQFGSVRSGSSCAVSRIVDLTWDSRRALRLFNSCGRKIALCAFSNDSGLPPFGMRQGAVDVSKLLGHRFDPSGFRNFVRGPRHYCAVVDFFVHDDDVPAIGRVTEHTGAAGGLAVIRRFVVQQDVVHFFGFQAMLFDVLDVSTGCRVPDHVPPAMRRSFCVAWRILRERTRPY